MKELLTKKQEELTLPESIIVTLIVAPIGVLTAFGTMFGMAVIATAVRRIIRKRKGGEEGETE